MIIENIENIDDTFLNLTIGITGEYYREKILPLLQEINNLQQENQELKEALDKAIKQSVTDHKYASECEDKVITYKSVLDEIREHTKIGISTYTGGGSRTAMFEVFDTINEILDKVKE